MYERNYTIRIASNPASSTSMSGWATLSNHFTTWRHLTKFKGGNWEGEGFITEISEEAPYGMTSEQMHDFFTANLGRRVIIGAGGRDWWEGQIVRMELRRRGQTFVRTMEEMSNRVKTIYTRIGPQLLANGDVEGGIWGTLGTPTTIELTTDWVAKGTQAMHCVADGDGAGMEIELAVGITANVSYVCGVIVNVVSGSWQLRIRPTGSDQPIAKKETTTTGRTWLSCQIPDTNTETSVDIILYGRGATHECYADGAIFRTAPEKAETEWYEDAASIAAYGTKEFAILEGELEEDEASAIAQRRLTQLAWPQTLGPARGGTFDPSEAPEDHLIVTCAGMVWTMSGKYSLVDSSQNAHVHIGSLLAEAEFISSSTAAVHSNTTSVLLESGNPMTVWEQMEKVIDVGGGTGAPWQGGVYPGQEFRYLARETSYTYEFRNGRLLHRSGGEVEPVEAQPGFILLADMPLVSVPAGAGTRDDPRWQLATEMEFIDDGNAVYLEWSFDEEDE